MGRNETRTNGTTMNDAAPKSTILEAGIDLSMRVIAEHLNASRFSARPWSSDDGKNNRIYLSGLGHLSITPEGKVSYASLTRRVDAVRIVVRTALDSLVSE